ncbi:MAG: hypothetical protein LQ352_001918 [Teloschistes flavicans]|nr:MAG: hypothetical protein LQ352_001918 [Teloschistes flavicans]
MAEPTNSEMGRQREAQFATLPSSSTSGTQASVQSSATISQNESLLDESLGDETADEIDVSDEDSSVGDFFHEISELPQPIDTAGTEALQDAPHAIRRLDAVIDKENDDLRTQAFSLRHFYSRALHQLCFQTGSLAFEHDCLEGLSLISAKICSLDLSVSYESDAHLEDFAYAAIVYTWLIVSSKRLQGLPPSEDELVHAKFATFFLSSCEVLKLNIRRTAIAIKHYQHRSFDSRGQWSLALNTWWSSIIMDDPNLPHHRNEEASRYWDVYQQKNIEGLTNLLVHQEVSLQQSSMRELPDSWSARWHIAMMTSIEPDLLRAIIEGQVTRKAEIRGTSLANDLYRMRTDTDPPPSIYQNALCDKEGFSPTPFHWRQICQLMRLYVSETREGDKLAMIVDQLIAPSANWPKPTTSRAKKLRRYAEWMSYVVEESDIPCLRRRSIIWKFTNEMGKRLRKAFEDGQQHVPLVAPVVEIGFTDRTADRLRDHRCDWKSNYLTNLAEALAQYLYPDWFHLNQQIIYQCWRPDQPWASEILLTRLAQGYISQGGGFSHRGAGFSNGSAWKKRSMEEWARFNAQVNSDERFRKRFEALGLRADKKAKELQEYEQWQKEVVAAAEGLIDAATEAVQAVQALRRL